MILCVGNSGHVVLTFKMNAAMNNRILFAAGAVLAFGTATFAQTSFDAAHLYGRELIGTARYVAMGGAMGALGSDASIISQNPAGITFAALGYSLLSPRKAPKNQSPDE